MGRLCPERASLDNGETLSVGGLKNPAVEPGLERVNAQETQRKHLRSCYQQVQKSLECHYRKSSIELKKLQTGSYSPHPVIRQSEQHGRGVQAHSQIRGCLRRCELALHDSLKVAGDEFRVVLCLRWRLGPNEPVIQMGRLCPERASLDNGETLSVGGLKNPAVEPGLERVNAQETQRKHLRSCYQQVQKSLECHYRKSSIELKKLQTGSYSPHPVIRQSEQHGRGVQAHSQIRGCLRRCELALHDSLKVAGDEFRVVLCLRWRLGPNEPVIQVDLGEGEAEDDKKDRNDSLLREPFPQAIFLLSLGTQPSGEDAATFLTDDGRSLSKWNGHRICRTARHLFHHLVF
ncbi:UNVERIFIED_CONTAM: hypothetical protein FKN15_022857 [Acipenser sinensis]